MRWLCLVPIREGDIQGKPVAFETLESVVAADVEEPAGDLDLLEDIEAEEKIAEALGDDNSA